MKSNHFPIVLCFAVFVGLCIQDASAYYAPEMGRFISRDPIEYEAEDVNLHRYIENRPIRDVDPGGLTPMHALLCAGSCAGCAACVGPGAVAFWDKKIKCC